MTVSVRATLTALLVAVSLATFNATASSQVAHPMTTGRFDVDVRQSKWLPAGKTTFEIASATGAFTNEFGIRNALKIQMFPPANGPRAVFTLVLYVDSADRITQADLIYGTPNTVTQRTVASTPDEIANRFADYSYRGGRLRLKANGAYVDGPESTERLTFAWDIGLDLSVERHLASPIRSPSQLDDHQPAPPRSAEELAQRYKQAHMKKNVDAIGRLFYWGSSTEETRATVTRFISRDVANAIKDVAIRPLAASDATEYTQNGVVYRTTLPATSKLVITFVPRAENGTAYNSETTSYFVGVRNGEYWLITAEPARPARDRPANMAPEPIRPPSHSLETRLLARRCRKGTTAFDGVARTDLAERTATEPHALGGVDLWAVRRPSVTRDSSGVASYPRHAKQRCVLDIVVEAQTARRWMTGRLCRASPRRCWLRRNPDAVKPFRRSEES